MVSSGSIPVNVVFELVVYSIPSVGYILIPMTLYIGIIVSLSRMSSESEMVVMKSIGVSTVTFMKIALTLALVSAIVTLINSLYFLPEANQKQKLLKDSAQSNLNYLPIESGKFTEFSDYVFYINQINENSDQKKSVSSVFVVKNLDRFSFNKSSFLSATKGHTEYDEDGMQWFSFDTGNLYVKKGEDDTFKKINFSRLSAPIFLKQSQSVKEANLQMMLTSQLLENNDLKSKIELQWRIAPFFACFVLAIIAIPLSMVNPRQGKFARLGPAICLFVCYYLALLAIRNILNSDKFPLFPGLYIVPIVFLLFVALPLNLERNRSPASKKKKLLNK